MSDTVSFYFMPNCAKLGGARPTSGFDAVLAGPGRKRLNLILQPAAFFGDETHGTNAGYFLPYHRAVGVRLFDIFL